MRPVRILARLLAAVSLALGLSLAGCASPTPRLYTLSAVPGPALPGGPHAVELRQIALAGYLERPGIVRGRQGGRLLIAGDADRWAAPLDEIITHALVEDLTQRLPGSLVFPITGAITARPDVMVELDIQSFSPEPGGQVVLAAQIGLRPRDAQGDAAARNVRLGVRPRSPAVPDLVAALGQATGELADVIAGMLRALPSPRRATRTHA